MIDLNQSKIGHYRVGDLKFYSKLEAIEMHGHTGIHPHWDFNEAEFSQANWTQEPQESILELYRQRAQQLREKYDYIALMYSAGADSQTAFESFINNDILLDEAVSLINYEASGTQDNYLNHEIFNLAIPKVLEAQTKQPNLQHRIIDISDSVINWHKNNHSFDWLYYTNCLYGPNNIIRQQLSTQVNEWQQIINSGKSFCLIYGVDRPRIRHVQGKYYFHFLDNLVANSIITVNDPPVSVELFYWTPDLGSKICIKQGHLIRNYLESTPNTKKLPFVSGQKSDLAYKEVNGTKHWLSLDGVQKLIYPELTPDIIKPQMGPSIMIGRRDDWFLEKDSFDAKDQWEKGINHLLKILPNYWLLDPEAPWKGIKGCLSKDYLLG